MDSALTCSDLLLLDLLQEPHVISVGGMQLAMFDSEEDEAEEDEERQLQKEEERAAHEPEPARLEAEAPPAVEPSAVSSVAESIIEYDDSFASVPAAPSPAQATAAAVAAAAEPPVESAVTSVSIGGMQLAMFDSEEDEEEEEEEKEEDAPRQQQEAADMSSQQQQQQLDKELAAAPASLEPAAAAEPSQASEVASEIEIEESFVDGGPWEQQGQAQEEAEQEEQDRSNLPVSPRAVAAAVDSSLGSASPEPQYSMSFEDLGSPAAAAATPSVQRKSDEEEEEEDPLEPPVRSASPPPGGRQGSPGSMRYSAAEHDLLDSSGSVEFEIETEDSIGDFELDAATAVKRTWTREEAAGVIAEELLSGALRDALDTMLTPSTPPLSPEASFDGAAGLLGRASIWDNLAV